MVKKLMAMMGTILKMVKVCNFCGLKGHNEAQCFKKNLEKALAWWKKKTKRAIQTH